MKQHLCQVEYGKKITGCKACHAAYWRRWLRLNPNYRRKLLPLPMRYRILGALALGPLTQDALAKMLGTTNDRCFRQKFYFLKAKGWAKCDGNMWTRA